MTSVTSTDQYAVFGAPIEQSKSPRIHQLFALQTAQTLQYQKILGHPGHFADDLARFFAEKNARGCNVTMPFKQDAADWVDSLTENAERAGAVNTVIRGDNGHFIGDNTDGIGLVLDLQRQSVQLSDKRVLLVGAGGATRGVVLPLLNAGIKQVNIVNRTVEKAETLVSWFNNEAVVSRSFESIRTKSLTFDVIVNCTSASFSGSLPDLDDQCIASANAIYDMVYMATPTVFVKKGQEVGVPIVSDGLGMLVGQAAQSFYLWRGVMPDISPVLETLRNEL